MYVVPALQMPGMGELMLILLIVLIIFGPGRLPEVFSSFGKSIKSFKDAQKEDPTDVTPRKPVDMLAHADEAKEVEKAKETTGS